MRKTIVISIVTSAMLFGANVTELSTDQVNKTQNSTISNATVDQGKTEITGVGTTVNDLTIIEKGDDGTTGNLIDNVNISGTTEGEELLLNVNQGGTSVSGDATVENVTINSDSTINNGGDIQGAGEVSQGKTSVGGGSSLKNVEIHSTNSINNPNITGELHVLVTQGTLEVDNNATADDNAEADNVDITSNNSIGSGVVISDSTVRQSYTSIDGAGTTVSGLNINQTNTLNGEGEISNGSNTLQGVTKIDTGADVTGLTTNVTNTIDNFNSDKSTTAQNYINIHSDSTVQNMSVTTNGTNNNTITNTTENNSTVAQNTINITNNSNLNGLTTSHNNIISDSTINNGVVQQDVIDLNNTSGSFTTNSTNTINNVTVNSLDNQINQAVIVSNDSTLNSTSITSTNNIDSVNLNNGKIAQNYVSINKANIFGLTLNNSNSVTGTNEIGSDINNSSISQAEVIIASNGNIIDISSLTQETTNNVTDATLNDSIVEQAKVAIGNSTVSGVGININATNDITSDIDSSYVSQNGLKICDSTVNNLDIDQDNDITGGTITGSTLTQGNINIAGESSDCEVLARLNTNKEY
jgi:hypothetical protein